ncbi:MAG: OadG family protein [Melioribacteraceae bacterium]
MIFQQINNIDSTKAIQDTLAGVANSKALQEVNISFSNLTSAEIVVTVLGYGIVFMALLLLFFSISTLSRIILKKQRKNRKRKDNKTNKLSEEDGDDISGETAAAISMALYLNFDEAHDKENTILTIKKIQRAYSPWNSKYHGLRRQPKH